MRRIGSLALPAILAAFSLTCGSDTSTTPMPTVASIVVTPGTDTLVTLGRTRQFTAAALDASHQPVSGVTIVWRSSASTVASVDSATGVVTAVANGSVTIRAVVGSVTGQAALTVAQVVAAVVVTPGTSALTTIGVTQPFSAVANDSSGAAIAGVRFLWQSSDAAVATVDTNGLARSKAPGTAIITAAGRGIPGNAVLTVTQTPRRLAFSAQPDTAVAGAVFTRAVQVEIRDSAGALITGARNPVTLAIPTSAGAAILSGTTTVNAVGGVASFSAISLGGPVGSYQLTASGTALVPDTSSALILRPGAVARLSVASPASATAGVPFAATAQGYDAYNNFATTAHDTIALTGANGFGGRVTGSDSAQLTGGTATFPAAILTDPGRFILTASLHGISATASMAMVASVVFDNLLSTGFETACARSVEQNTFCWGLGQDDQLGNGHAGNARVPRLVAGGLTFAQVVPGYFHTCGITTSGAAYCWGSNGIGQLGDGAPFGGPPDSVPQPVVGGHSFTELAVGLQHTCGVTTTNQMYCWGDDGFGELGSGKSTTYGFTTTPTLVSGGISWAHVTASNAFFFTCGLSTGGIAYCFGENEYGQLGVNSTAQDSVPTAVVGAVPFTSIAAGIVHVCALAADSTAYCWGTNGLGRGSPTADSVAGAVSGGNHFRQIVAGGDRNCGVTAVGAVYCWDASVALDGQWGTSSAAIGLGGGYQCEIITGNAFCRGSNGFGELGSGSSDPFASTFVPVFQTPPPAFAPSRR